MQDVDVCEYARNTCQNSPKMEENKPLAQIIDNGVDELQDTNVHTNKAVSIDDGNMDETMEIPHPGKYYYYDPDRPSIESKIA